MRHKNYIWLVFLCSLIGFIACEKGEAELTASDDDTVAVELALSVSDNEETAVTRMTATNTQGNNVDGGSYTFRGLDYVYLFPFHTNLSTPPISGTSQPLKDRHVILSSGEVYKNYRSFTYSTIKMPKKTNSFLVYARPSGGGAQSTPTSKFAFGSLSSDIVETDAINTSASSIIFTPDKIWDDDNLSSYTNYKTTLSDIATYLTTVANANVNGTPLYAQTGDLGILFSALSNDGHPFPYGSAYIQQKLKDLDSYNYTGLSQNVKSMISQRYSYFNSQNAWGKLKLDNYPKGVFLFQWQDATNCFVVLDNVASKTEINPSILDPKYFAYPAQLWYYGNSSIYTTSQELESTAFKKDNWNNVLSNDKFVANGEVDDNTTAVAITNKLQYGVSRLKLRIHAGASSLPNLKTLDLLQLKGVMVTHQYKAGFDFQPLATNNTEDEDPYYVIYDADVQNSKGGVITPPGNNKWSDPNHTLLLPTKAGDKVYVIAEFFYNGKFEVGKNNNAPLIPGYRDNPIFQQTYFYMVGELDPGLDANNQQIQAFVSGKYTAVDATINNFEGAYNYVPDLSSPSLVLSLKLELKWEQTEPNSVWLH